MGNKPVHHPDPLESINVRKTLQNQFSKTHNRRGLNKIGADENLCNKNDCVAWNSKTSKYETNSCQDFPKFHPKGVNKNWLSKERASTANARLSTYQCSSTYRRKLYADSLPKIIRSKNESNEMLQKNFRMEKTKSPLPPINTSDRKPGSKTISRNYYKNNNLYRSQVSCGQAARDESLVRKQTPNFHVHNQWNDNKMENDSICSKESVVLPLVDRPCRKTVPRPLPQLNSLQYLLEKFETEISSSSISLREAMESLVDTDLLVGRGTDQQKLLLTKTEDGIMCVQILLSKMHRHIAHSHEFCNMLHRIDESLQTFSKAICTVTAWSQRLEAATVPRRKTCRFDSFNSSMNKKLMIKKIDVSDGMEKLLGV